MESSSTHVCYFRPILALVIVPITAASVQLPTPSINPAAPSLLQCGPQHDDLLNKAEQETELAKQEACNVKQLTSEKREAGQRVEQANKEVGAGTVQACWCCAGTNLAYESSHTDMLGLGHGVALGAKEMGGLLLSLWQLCDQLTASMCTRAMLAPAFVQVPRP